MATGTAALPLLKVSEYRLNYQINGHWRNQNMPEMLDICGQQLTSWQAILTAAGYDAALINTTVLPAL